MILFYIISANLIISAFSLIGVITLGLKENFLKKILMSLVSLSTGLLLGGALLHLMPEAMDYIDPLIALEIMLVSFVGFFFVERTFHWRHCHDENCKVHSFGYMNLYGDAIHNFIDGLIIASAFVISVPIGISTSVALAFHEIPQEIGDFGVLLHAGFTKKKALIFNFIVALFSVLGGIVGFVLSTQTEGIIPYILPVAAGGFLYIATSDLIPELKKEVNPKKSISSFVLFVVGILLMYGYLFL